MWGGSGALRPRDMAGMVGKMRNEAPEDGIWDGCGSVGGAGCCLWRERQSSESTSTLRMATPIQTQSQEFNLCSISTHSTMSGHPATTSHWIFWGKEGREVERVKRKSPSPKAIDPAGPCKDWGCLAASQRSGWNGPSSVWTRLSHHFLGCRTGWFPGKRWELWFYSQMQLFKDFQILVRVSGSFFTHLCVDELMCPMVPPPQGN